MKKLFFILFIVFFAGSNINAMEITLEKNEISQKKHKHLKRHKHPFGHLKRPPLPPHPKHPRRHHPRRPPHPPLPPRPKL